MPRRETFRMTLVGHFGDSPASNHLHWYKQQKLTAKSIKQAQKLKIQ